VAKRMRMGKSSELTVAGELIRHGLDVYLPCVDDQAIDLVIRADAEEGPRYYDVQVKSVAGYNRIIGVRSPEHQRGRYVLVVHYRHGNRPDEFLYLAADQIRRYHLKDSTWGDLVLNRAERDQLHAQDLADLARRIGAGDL